MSSWKPAPECLSQSICQVAAEFKSARLQLAFIFDHMQKGEHCVGDSSLIVIFLKNVKSHLPLRVLVLALSFHAVCFADDISASKPNSIGKSTSNELAKGGSIDLTSELSTPFQIALVAPIQFARSDRSVAGLRIDILFGKNENTRGIDVGLVNYTSNDFGGLGFGLVNIVGHDAKGLDFGLVNYTSNDFWGLGFGSVNLVGHDGKGLQCGAFNWAKGDFAGIQSGALVSVAEGSFHGIQGAFVSSTTGEFKGLQIL